MKFRLKNVWKSSLEMVSGGGDWTTLPSRWFSLFPFCRQWKLHKIFPDAHTHMHTHTLMRISIASFVAYFWAHWPHLGAKN